ncbi:MAG: PAS domain S-box protein [Methanoregulaceae archaeon]
MHSVLYVDDEEYLLEIAKIFLEESGEFLVTPSVSAQNALDSLKFRSFDAIVSDYQMPGMNGIAFLKEVRERFGDIPFILFTGRGREEVVIDAINNGADFYLQKGGDPQAQFAELSHKIRQAVRRKEAERSLQDSERRLADIIDFLPDATFAVDSTGHVIAWNHAIEEMTGIPSRDMLGKGDFEYAFPAYGIRQPILIDMIDEPLEKIARFYSHVRRDGNTLTAESDRPVLKGKRSVILLNACPLYNRAGERTGAIESIRDITEFKVTEQELHRQFEQLAESERTIRINEERLRMAQMIGHIGSWEFDIATARFWGSAEAYRIFGIIPTYENVIPENLGKTIPGWDRVNQALSDMITEGKEYDIEYVIHPADGAAPKVVHSIARLERDGAGNPVKVVGVVQDITECKQAEDVLRESGERYRLLLENSHDGILINELTQKGPGKFLEANDQACRIIGMTREDLQSVSLVDLDTPEMKSRAPEIMREIMENKRAVFQTRYRTPDGREKIIDIRVSLFDLRGRPTMLSVVRDITVLRQAEEALRQANKKLSLLSGITRHDISNQLLALNGFVEHLHKKIPDPTLEDYFTRIRAISRRISAMIQFTREYEKIGVQTPVWLDLWTLVNAAGENATPGQVVLKNDIPPGTEVYADPLITKVVFNLIDNALRHGGTVTTIRFALEFRSGNPVIVCEDDGVGIGSEFKEEIFERGSGKNTGFGLSLSREILDITGITIQEAGTPGSGARFEILVPPGGFRSRETER